MNDKMKVLAAAATGIVAIAATAFYYLKEMPVDMKAETPVDTPEPAAEEPTA